MDFIIFAFWGRKKQKNIGLSSWRKFQIRVYRFGKQDFKTRPRRNDDESTGGNGNGMVLEISLQETEEIKGNWGNN